MTDSHHPVRIRPVSFEAMMSDLTLAVANAERWHARDPESVARLQQQVIRLDGIYARAERELRR